MIKDTEALKIKILKSIQKFNIDRKKYYFYFVVSIVESDNENGTQTIEDFYGYLDELKDIKVSYNGFVQQGLKVMLVITPHIREINSQIDIYEEKLEWEKVLYSNIKPVKKG